MISSNRRIVTLYWENIAPRLVKTQAQVFAHLGYKIDQICKTGADHGDFLDGIIAELGEDDTLLCVDIDCFPTNAAVVEHAFAFAEAGGLIGCSQVTAHIDPDRIFTAPMFLCLTKRLWRQLGSPSFHGSATADVAQNLHDIAVKSGVKIEYLDPYACVIPKWNLAGKALFGVGTFYRGGVFHLYESRKSPYTFVLYAVAEDILANRQTDILALCHRAMRIYPFDRMLTRLNRIFRIYKLRRLLNRLKF